MASLIGKEIGKYRITERIGRGGMAEVYLGVHTHLDRPVAIKVLHGHLVEGGDFIERFKREAKAVANLRHPNIVQVYDFDIQDDLIFMVMEYIDGINLQEKLVDLGKRGERLPITQVASIVNDIASALDYAHTLGMLHRDVKPSNIMVGKDGKAYLTDFGIAKIIGDNKLTATGTLIGTPAYMSPEQGRGEELTEESDIYSLGIVAFEMLTGRVPYDAQTPIGIVHKQISDPVPRITELVQDVPVSAQEVIDRALAKTPANRFSSAEELVGALRLALEALEATDEVMVRPTMEMAPAEHEVLTAPTVSMEADQNTQAEELVQATAVETAAVPEVPRGRKLSTGAWLGAGAVVLVVAAVLLTVVFPVFPLGGQSQPDAGTNGEASAALPDQPDIPDASVPVEESAGQGESYDELYNLGLERWEAGDLPGASDAFRRLTELYPEDFQAWYSLAEVYFNTGEDQYKDEAHWSMDNALALMPENANAHWLMGQIRYYMFNNPGEAVADLTRAIELDSGVAVYYNHRGVIYWENGQFELCVDDYNKFEELDPGNPVVYVERAECYLGMDAAEAARADFEHFMSLTEGNSDWALKRGEVQDWLETN